MDNQEKLLKILTETCPGVDFQQETALIDDGILEISGHCHHCLGDHG